MISVDLLLARHGATAWSRDALFCGSSDVELSEEGRAQAEQLAGKLEREKLAAIYCSPLRRAVATALAVARRHHLEPAVIAELREMDFGAWEGRERTEIVANDAAMYEAWQRDPAAVTPAGGEAAYVVAGRAIAALAPIVERHQGATVLIVAHKTLNRILICHYLGLPVAAYRDRIAQDVCALNRIEIRTAGQARVTLLNDTTHVF